MLRAGLRLVPRFPKTRLEGFLIPGPDPNEPFLDNLVKGFSGLKGLCQIKSCKTRLMPKKRTDSALIAGLLCFVTLKLACTNFRALKLAFYVACILYSNVDFSIRVRFIKRRDTFI